MKGITRARKTTFTQNLMQWHHTANGRHMPWKGEQDPYRIWLSEVILQQTRVEQGWQYYLRFTEAYPTVQHLAAAPDTEVFKHWEGLGYYARCRNLLATARFITHTLQGRFPDTYEGLLSLKGIGPYTAAAIASFAWNLPHAVVDGNVIRVLARYFCIADDVRQPGVQQAFRTLAGELLDEGQPAAWNQAIMDFGATVCKPAQPLCHDCPLRQGCEARVRNMAAELPVKAPAPVRKVRYFMHLVPLCNEHVWVQERTAKDIWRHLHQFWLEELPGEGAFLQADADAMAKALFGNKAKAGAASTVYRQALTHQQVCSRFWLVHLPERPEMPVSGKWIPLSQIKEVAFPVTITRFIAQNLPF